jgi:hypothetical protein
MKNKQKYFQFQKFIQVFIFLGFIIFLSNANGQKLEKFLVDNFAKRAAIIPTEATEHISQETIKIPFVNDKLLALPEGRTMFANKNTIEVNHGGITLEEMIVPFIKIIK